MKLVKTTMKRGEKLRLNRLKAAMMLAVLGAASGSAIAKSWDSGDWSLSIDTTVSYGASWRVEDRDERLVGKANLNPFVGTLDLNGRIAAPGRWSLNSDNGNLNYDQGDLISNAVKFTSDIGFSYKDWGGFFRVTGFYDFENADNDKLTEVAKDFVGKRFRLLDAYVYKDFEIGERFGSVRLGRQVVSWGESTFIQQGINVINPVDVSKIRVAGAELKEAFLPIDMINFSFDLTDNLSMEAIYMFEFEQTDPDPMGTYFSTSDIATPGSSYVALGFGIVPELDNIGTYLQMPGAESLVANIVSFSIPRAVSQAASDDGQFGVAFRYYAEALNQTEFGLYYLNYHSRLPLLNGVALGNSNAPIATQLQGLSLDSSLFGPTSPNSGSYYIVYPEDIHMLGLSFNTTINALGVSLQGELSYRDNVPLQIDDVELLFAALSPLNTVLPAEYNHFNSQLGDYEAGEVIQGWERHKVSQLQFTATKVFGPNDFFGTDQIVLLGEVGFNQVWDLPDPSVLRYEAPGTDTSGGPSAFSGGNGRNPVTEAQQYFATPFSWGYRLITRFDYNGAFGSAWNLSPRLGFNHDVNGNTPGPGGSFIEGRKTATLGMTASYLEKWSVDVSYTSYFGAGIHNLLSDRDYASVNVKYSF